MGHPLEDVIRSANAFILIGDSSEDRFPGFSYDAYTREGKLFYCIDLGGLTESRGPTKGGKVYQSASELPAEHDDLAIIWLKPDSAMRGVDVAHEAGCKRVWFSFQTGHAAAVEHARSLGMEVVEIGRCPVYYLEGKAAPCKAHTLLTKVSGSYNKPPQTDANAKRRELW